MDVITGILEQEEESLQEVMTQYGDYLLRTASLMMKDHHTAEEVVQDTFIIAFKKIEQLKDPAHLKSWLTSILINQCRQRMRLWGFKHIFPISDVIDWMTESDAPNPEESLLEMARNKHLSDGIRELDYKYREVITLYYFNEMKIKDIAIHTKAKENTIKSRLKRGRKLLGEILQREGIEHD